MKQSTDIVEVVGGYIPLKRAGANFVALCPFHQEKSPSFNVNVSRQIFHCFGCQKGGDALHFVMEMEGLGFAEAVERLAKRLGIPVEYEAGSVHGREDRSLSEKLYAVHEKVTEWWHRLLLSDHSAQVARDYLAVRGVKDTSIKAFRLGFSPANWDEIKNWGLGHGFSEEILEQAGLLIQKEESSHRYSRFRGRLMFPIGDMQGRIIGFSARTLDPNDTGAKYINSPETPIFKKNQILFGLHRARKSILDKQSAIICEGQLDTIALHAAGFTHAVAPQGTAFGEGHVRLIKRLTQEVILCFDSDNAGQKAAARIWDELLKNDLTVTVITIPNGHDPDSFIRDFGPQEFQNILENRANYIDFLMGFWKKEIDLRSSAGRKELVMRLGAVASLSPNPLVIDEIARKAAMAAQTRPDIIRESWRKWGSQWQPKSTPASDVSGTGPTEDKVEADDESRKQLDFAAIPRHEMSLITLLLSTWEPEFIRAGQVWIRQEWMTDPVCKSIVNVWCRHHESSTSSADDDGDLNQESLLDHLQDKTVQAFCRGILVRGECYPDPIRQLDDVLTKIRNANLDFEIAALTRQASEANEAGHDNSPLLQQQQLLRNRKKIPLSKELPLTSTAFKDISSLPKNLLPISQSADGFDPLYQPSEDFDPDSEADMY